MLSLPLSYNCKNIMFGLYLVSTIYYIILFIPFKNKIFVLFATTLSSKIFDSCYVQFSTLTVHSDFYCWINSSSNWIVHTFTSIVRIWRTFIQLLPRPQIHIPYLTNKYSYNILFPYQKFTLTRVEFMESKSFFL